MELLYYMSKMSTVDITSLYYREIPVFFNLFLTLIILAILSVGLANFTVATSL